MVVIEKERLGSILPLYIQENITYGKIVEKLLNEYRIKIRYFIIIIILK
jgi:hypothetical protein